MSVAFSHDSSDYLRLTAGSPFTIGTGDYSVGQWLYIEQSAAGSAQWWTLADASPPSGDGFAISGRTGSATTAITFLYNLSPAYVTEYTYSTGVWYWCVSSRSGTTARFRVFNDSTSTTPLHDATQTGVGDNHTTLDTISIGYRGSGDGCFAARITNFKLHTGVEWTNAESRTEAQYYGIQTAGGTDRLCWRLTDIDADTNGLYELGGAGPNFTNSGAVTDAAMPTYLSEAGGGSIGFDDGDGPVFLTRLRPATTVRLV